MSETGIPFFDTYSTYTVDRPLFEQLGLVPFENITNWTKASVGTVKHHDATIEIEVDGAPAQFWRFKIIDGEGGKHEVSTGSGSLSEYWPAIIQIANGCLVVEKYEKPPAELPHA